MCVCVCVPYFHNMESARKILLTRLKKGNACLGKLALETPDTSMIKLKKRLQIQRPKERNLDLHTACLNNS